MKKGKQRQSVDSDTTADPPSTPTVIPPPFKWSENSQPLAPLLRQKSLPIVVTCNKKRLSSLESMNMNFAQPLLLHTKRTVRKVLATSLLYVQNGCTLERRLIGDHLVIPEDYKGWFAVLGNPDEVKSDKVITHFGQIGHLALSKCQRFLIGGNKNLTAFQLPENHSASKRPPKTRTLYPGDVLRMGALYAAETTLKVNTGLFRREKVIKKEERFLLCTDDEDRDMYIPVGQRGVFYVLAVEGQISPKVPILKMTDICTRYKFPCVVKLLYGRVPQTPCAFTGVLMLNNSQIESSVIASTILNLRNILLDVPVDSQLQYFVAETTPELVTSSAYIQAQKLCQEKALSYMRNMKVVYHVHTDDATQRQPLSGEEHYDQPEGSRISTYDQPLEELAISIEPAVPPHLNPTVVGEQELFNPPNPPSLSPKLPAGPLNGKKVKKQIVKCESEEIQEMSAIGISGDSPTVLRKDQSFSLPKPPEMLHVKQLNRSISSPNIIRPLPPIIHPSPNTITRGHYAAMDSDTVDASAHLNNASDTDRHAYSTLPPNQSQQTHSTADYSAYGQLWDSGESAVPIDPENSYLLLENNLAFENAAQPPKPCAEFSWSRSQSGESYLTMPLFRTDVKKRNNHMTQSSRPDDFRSVPAPTLASAIQPYETMSLLDAKLSPTSSNSKKFIPPPLPPLPTKLNSETVDPRPLPPLPIKSEVLVSKESNLTHSASQERAESSASETSGYIFHFPPVYINGENEVVTFTEQEENCMEAESGGVLVSPANSHTTDDAEKSDDVLYENIEFFRTLSFPKGGEEPLSDHFQNLEGTNAVDSRYTDPPPPLPRRPITKVHSQSVPALNSNLNNYDSSQKEYFNVNEVRNQNHMTSPLLLPPAPCISTCNRSYPYLNPCVDFSPIEAQPSKGSHTSCTPSATSMEDDLPLGATYASFHSPESDSGCPSESLVEPVGCNVPEMCKMVSMSVTEVTDALQKLGLSQGVVNILQQEKLDGRFLASHTKEELIDALPGVKKIDILKIQMFVSSGWSPKE